MAGNVWEWTRSLWGSVYPYMPDDGREAVEAPDESRRVLRGGAFSLGATYARCSARVRNHPDGRNRYIGFRVSVSTLSPRSELPGGASSFRAETENGGARSRPRPLRRAGRITTAPRPGISLARGDLPRMFETLASWENLFSAYRKAAAGKRGRSDVAAFEHRLEDHLLALQAELLSGTYGPGGYRSFLVHELKRRLISAAPFRDRVVHHALCNLIEPVFEGSFTADSFANRRGKGTHQALRRCQLLARRYRYVLQCDVRQFFPSIDHEILRAEIARKVTDPRVLALVEQILWEAKRQLERRVERLRLTLHPGPTRDRCRKAYRSSVS